MVITRVFEIKTDGRTALINITGQVERLLRSSRVAEGLLNVFIPGNTVAITTLTCEGGNLSQQEAIWKNHAFFKTEETDIQIKTALIGSSLSLPFSRGQLLLGTWQEIVLVDFGNDERWHQVSVQMQGE
jgi:secondary thiamine-phosphate synthase enzyme